jgi:hypothetical protein
VLKGDRFAVDGVKMRTVPLLRSDESRKTIAPDTGSIFSCIGRLY